MKKVINLVALLVFCSVAANAQTKLRPQSFDAQSLVGVPGVGGGGGDSSFEYVIYRDTKAATTSGGTFTAGAWRTRTLNETQSSSGTSFSRSTDTFTLTAGTYKIYAIAPAYSVNRHKAVLYNVTDAAIEILGQSTSAHEASAVTTNSVIKGMFTIAETKSFQIQHRCTVGAGTAGFGLESSSGEKEVYTTVYIRKLE